MTWLNYNIEPKMNKTSFGRLLSVELGEKGKGRIRDLIPTPTCGPVLKAGFTRKSGAMELRETTIEDSLNVSSWIAMVSTASKAYAKNSVGFIEVSEGVRVLSYGVKAIGKAGRASVAPEYLLVVPFWSWVYVSPVGNEQSYYLHFTPNGVDRIDSYELDQYLELNDLEKPNLVDVPIKTDVHEDHNQALREMNYYMKARY